MIGRLKEYFEKLMNEGTEKEIRVEIIETVDQKQNIAKIF